MSAKLPTPVYKVPALEKIKKHWINIRMRWIIYCFRRDEYSMQQNVTQVALCNSIKKVGAH